MAGAVVEGVVAGSLTAWVVVEARIMWRDRTPVTFDHRTGRYRSVRAVKKDVIEQRRRRRATYPVSHVETRPRPRLTVVRDEDIAS